MKKLGWILIICWILFSLVTVYPLRLPLEIAKDPFWGFGKVAGYLLFLFVGIWLISRKKGITEKEKKEERGEREK